MPDEEADCLMRKLAVIALNAAPTPSVSPTCSLGKNDICYLGANAGLNALTAAFVEMPQLKDLKYTPSLKARF